MGFLGKIRNALLAGGAGVAALAAVNAAVGRVRPPKDVSEGETLGGEPLSFAWQHGRVFYRVAGDAQASPVLLVHGVGVGESSFTWRRNFDALAQHFRVYAIDLPGFGFSDKPPVAPYSAEFYAELITDFLSGVVKAPAHIVARSLGAAYAVHVADRRPALVQSLILIAPTGAGVLQSRPGVAGAAFYGLLHSPVLGTSFYNAMVSERGLRDHAREHLFYDKNQATPKTVARYYTLSHQPGAQYALTAFFSGYLNTDMRDAFARLTQPIKLVWGAHDAENPVTHAAALQQLNARATLDVFDRSRALPHEEQAEAFNQLVQKHVQPRTAAA